MTTTPITRKFNFASMSARTFDALIEDSGLKSKKDMMNEALAYYDRFLKAQKENRIFIGLNEADQTPKLFELDSANASSAGEETITIDEQSLKNVERDFGSFEDTMHKALFLYDQIIDFLYDPATKEIRANKTVGSIDPFKHTYRELVLIRPQP